MSIKKGARGFLLPALAVLLLLYGLIGLYTRPETMQYAAVAPADASLDSILKSAEEKRDGFAGVLSAYTVSATRYAYSLSTDNGSATVSLIAGGVDWFGVYPRYLLSGRLMTESEMRVGARVIVIDEPLALKLFGGGDPLEGSLNIEGHAYQVIGVVRYTRGVGTSDEFAAYIPLKQAAIDQMRADTVELAGTPIPKSGARTAFPEAAKAWVSGGTLTDGEKEIMRASMLLRILGGLFGFRVLFQLVRLAVIWVNARIDRRRAQLAGTYFARMLPGVALDVLRGIGIFACLGACGYGLLSLYIEPMYVFTEWVPDVVVEWSSLSTRFWELTGAAATPVSVRTSLYAEIRYYGAMLRWGVLLLLTGLLLRRIRFGRKKNVE